jgi:hypothetical protein
VDAFIKLMLSLKTLRLSPQRVKPTSSCEINFTKRSTRSMKGAPLATARAAEEGLRRLSAALAYFSKGT